MNEAALRKYIAVIRRACDLIEADLGSNELEKLLDQAVDQVIQPTPAIQPTVVSPKLPDETIHREERKKHIKSLMEIDCWPEAIPNFKVTNEDKKSRIDHANAVLDMTLRKSIEKLHFLDFGCGQGWIARQASHRGAASVTGYDIIHSDVWVDHDGITFTTNIGELKPKKYDVVLLYDVLDHCVDAEDVVSQVANLVAPGGTVYVRCHPWTSKHASHVVKQGLNKAYIHLFLTVDELKELGYDPMFTRCEKNPMEAYRWWFRQFKIEEERRSEPERLSDFFKVPSFRRLIIEEQAIEPDRIEGFFRDMEVQFVDFRLSAKK